MCASVLNAVDGSPADGGGSNNGVALRSRLMDPIWVAVIVAGTSILLCCAMIVLVFYCLHYRKVDAHAFEMRHHGSFVGKRGDLSRSGKGGNHKRPRKIKGGVVSSGQYARFCGV